MGSFILAVWGARTWMVWSLGVEAWKTMQKSIEAGKQMKFVEKNVIIPFCSVVTVCVYNRR